MQPHERGDATEAMVIAMLKERLIPVAIPFSDNQRYDVVVQTPESRFLRMQIKTGRVRDGKIHFHGKSQHTNASGNTYQRYDGDVDYFLVYTPELDSLHAVGEHKFDSCIRLRVDEPKQADSSINWAEAYEFDERWPLDPVSER